MSQLKRKDVIRLKVHKPKESLQDFPPVQSRNVGSGGLQTTHSGCIEKLTGAITLQFFELTGFKKKPYTTRRLRQKQPVANFQTHR